MQRIADAVVAPLSSQSLGNGIYRRAVPVLDRLHVGCCERGIVSIRAATAPDAERGLQRFIAEERSFPGRDAPSTEIELAAKPRTFKRLGEAESLPDRSGRQ